jgi:hypothetical protein
MAEQSASEETLTFVEIDPVAGRERLLEIVAAPTGETARFFAATEGSGSAWLSRGEAEQVVAFFQKWLERTTTEGRS